MLLFSDIALALIVWSRFVKYAGCLSCSLHGTTFKNPPYVANDATKPMITKHPLHSTVECGSLCAQLGDQCATFVYNKESKECHLSDGMIDGKFGAVFGRRQDADCPTSMGYSTFGYDSVCMKIYNATGSDADAVAVCQSEGAHLLVIENEPMYFFIKWVLTCIGRGVPVLMDGYDNSDAAAYTTWNGQPLPFVLWAPNQPNGGNKKCLKLKKITFQFAKAFCTASLRDYVCQKDML